MSIEHNIGGSIVTTDRDGDRVRFGRIPRGGVSVRIPSTNDLIYIENDDVLEVAEFLKASHKTEIECDKCRGKGKVLR